MEKSDKDILPEPLDEYGFQEDMIHAFYVWVSMLDNRANSQPELKKVKYTIDRLNMCNEKEFHILLMTFLDFLNPFNLKLRNKPKTAKKDIKDFTEYVSSLNALHLAWQSLINPQHSTSMTREESMKILDNFKDLMKFMPERVQKAIANGPGPDQQYFKKEDNKN